MSHDVPVGEIVAFFTHADVHRDPVAALVVKTSETGILSLQPFPAHGGMSQIRMNVRHVQDPVLQEKPNIAVEYGGWDYRDDAHLRWCEQRAAIRDRNRHREQEQKDRDDRRRIEELHYQGYPTEAIVARLGGDWTPKRVAGYVSHLPKPEQQLQAQEAAK